MKKIDSFNSFQIKEIREIFPLICKEIPFYSGKEMCPKCKMHHTRMPNKEIFQQLLNLFDATDKAWSEVFYVDRASVSKLRRKYFMGSYNLKEVWNEKRFWDEWDQGIDEKPLEDFFDLLIKYPRAKEEDLMKITEINKSYFSMIMKNIPSLESKYREIISERELGDEYIFCIKCKIRKKEIYFKPIYINKTKRSVICNLCNKENTVKCVECGKLYNEKALIKNEKGLLMCKNCIN